MFGLPSVVRLSTSHALPAGGPDWTGWIDVELENRFVRLAEPGWSPMQLRRVRVRWHAGTGRVLPGSVLCTFPAPARRL